MSDVPYQSDLTADAWEAFATATLIRESLSLRGGGDATELKLKGDAQEAVMLPSAS